MGDIIHLDQDYFATCACGCVEFNIRLNGVGQNYDQILGTMCAECGERIDWEKTYIEEKEDQD